MVEYRDARNNAFTVIQSTVLPENPEEREKVKESILDSLFNVFSPKRKSFKDKS